MNIVLTGNDSLDYIIDVDPGKSIMIEFYDCYKYFSGEYFNLTMSISKYSPITYDFNISECKIINGVVIIDFRDKISVALDRDDIFSYSKDENGNVNKTKVMRILLRGIPISKLYISIESKGIFGPNIIVNQYDDNIDYTEFKFPSILSYDNEKIEVEIDPGFSYVIPTLKNARIIAIPQSPSKLYISSGNDNSAFEDLQSVPDNYHGQPILVNFNESLDISNVNNVFPLFIFIKPDLSKISLKVYFESNDNFKYLYDIISNVCYNAITLKDIEISVHEGGLVSLNTEDYKNDDYNPNDITDGSCINMLFKASSTYTFDFKTTPGKSIVFEVPVIKTAPGTHLYEMYFSTDHPSNLRYDIKYDDLISSEYNYNTIKHCEDYVIDKNSMSVYFSNDRIFLKNKILKLNSRDVYSLYCSMMGVNDTYTFVSVPEDTDIKLIFPIYVSDNFYLKFVTLNKDIDASIREVSCPIDGYKFLFITMSDKGIVGNDGYSLVADFDIDPDKLFMILYPDNGMYYLKSKIEITSYGDSGSWIYTTNIPSPTNVIRMEKYLKWGEPRGYFTIAGKYINPNSTYCSYEYYTIYDGNYIYGIVRGDKINFKFYVDDSIISYDHNIKPIIDDNQILIMDFIKSISVSVGPCTDDTDIKPRDDGGSKTVVIVNDISEGDSYTSPIDRSRTILNLITGEKKEIPLSKKLIKTTYDIDWKLVEIYGIFPKDPRPSQNDSYYLMPSKRYLDVGKEYSFDPKKKKIDLDDYEFIVYNTIRALVEDNDDFIFVYLVEPKNMFYINGHKRYCEKVKIIKRIEMNAKSLWEINTPIDVLFTLSNRFSSLIADIESYASRFYEGDIDPDFMLLYTSYKNNDNIITDFYKMIVDDNKIPTFVGPLFEMNISSVETLDKRVSLIKKIIESSYPTPYYKEESGGKLIITCCDFSDRLIDYFYDSSYNPHFLRDYIFTNDRSIFNYAEKFKDYSAIDHEVGRYFIDYYNWFLNFGDVKKKIYDRLMALPLFYETFRHIHGILANIGPNEGFIDKIKSNYVPPSDLLLLTKDNVIPDIDYIRDRVMEPIDIGNYNRYFITNYRSSFPAVYYDLVSISYFMEKVDKIEPIDFFYRKTCPPECVGENTFHPQFIYYRARYRSYHDRLHLRYDECECYHHRLPPGNPEQYLFYNVKNPETGFGHKNELLIMYRDFVSSIISSPVYRDVSYLDKTYTYSVMGFLYSYLSLVPEDGPHLIPLINNVDDDRYITKIYHAASRYTSTEIESKLISFIYSAKGAYNWYIYNKNRMETMYNIIKSDKSIEDSLIVDVARTFCRDINYWINRCSNFYFKAKLIYSSEME
ncbi:MAG: hypothetical protein QXD03_01975 [Candidatus Anstonellales archaeon]